MRKISLIGLAMLIVSIPTFAGDYLTNTNQNAAFLRMIARGASIDVDGVYSNPAGLAFLPKDGLQVALTIQSAYQTRDIAATSPLWTWMDRPLCVIMKEKLLLPLFLPYMLYIKKVTGHFPVALLLLVVAERLLLIMVCLCLMLLLLVWQLLRVGEY